MEAGSEAGSSRLQSCLELNVKVVVGGSERESEVEMKMEIDGALGNGRSESSVLLRERQNDMDVDVRARKKRKLANEEPVRGGIHVWGNWVWRVEILCWFNNCEGGRGEIVGSS